ncbi:MAG: 50S ribosomal protein L17 [Candidatus Neomarinimicrobiota bacterium]
MRKQVSGRKLGRKTAHRKAMLSNMAASLITHKKIKTTDARAKELRMFIEPLITFAKRGDMHARRQVLKKIRQKDIVATMFKDVAPVYADRNGGYTRIIKLGFRDNDRAAISQIELIDMVGLDTSGKDKKEKKAKKTAAAAAESTENAK